jgi:fatty acid-binding protein DegV
VYLPLTTLEYLHKGGRINTAKRFMGTALNVKPCLKSAMEKLRLWKVLSPQKSDHPHARAGSKRVGDSTPVRISPFHALCEDECLAMEERAIELLHPVEVIRSEVSPVIGAHVGPGTLSLAWIAG